MLCPSSTILLFGVYNNPLGPWPSWTKGQSFTRALELFKIICSLSGQTNLPSLTKEALNPSPNVHCTSFQILSIVLISRDVSLNPWSTQEWSSKWLYCGCQTYAHLIVLEKTHSKFTQNLSLLELLESPFCLIEPLYVAQLFFHWPMFRCKNNTWTSTSRLCVVTLCSWSWFEGLNG